MAMSYYDESEAPRDFRVSTPESDDNYTKCVLCYTVKKNFYCVDCVRNGSFIHSSMPYSDSFSEKQLRLMKIKRDRQIILEKCKKLLEPKLNKDILVTETKQSRNKLDLLKLAIDQRRSIIDRKRKELTELQSYNNDIRLRLPRYQKRVLNIRKHVLEQKSELQNKISLYSDQTQSLAALRRSRIRQLIRYIFPIYMSYDLSDSIEDLEFLGDDLEEPQKRPQLHIVAPWIDINADYSHIQTWVSQSKEPAAGGEPNTNPAQRARAALGLAAQLLALLAWTLDVRLPYAIALSEYSDPRSWRSCVVRVRAGAAALCARAGVAPLPELCPAPAPSSAPAPAPAPLAALSALHALSLAAAADDPELGRVETWSSDNWDAYEMWLAGDDLDEPEPPEHLHWPDTAQISELSCTPPPAPSLVTSAAASFASLWRGWTK
ncbi:unnamed protein product [Euphydryas editha]|uniref:Beclin 1-associated autophagy-related key regulator n=1 Tax=Euphydryas editha TaxID=104508 RepID=A0AAU9V191_EUPED|nr:unnamed protein product [Euphydryas editha]